MTWGHLLLLLLGLAAGYWFGFGHGWKWGRAAVLKEIADIAEAAKERPSGSA